MDELERRVTADGSATLFSSRYGQTFHSRHGAVAEALHVFLEGSGMGRRLRSGRPARVLEVGFGSGLNFLLTAQAALSGDTVVSYLALERELLPADLVASLGYQDFAPQPLAGYLTFRQSMGEFAPENYRTTVPGADLELRLGDATAAALQQGSFDAVYHDAFSPEANPELWSRGFLAELAAVLVPGGVLTTYTVKGEVRRSLAAAGLQVTKEPGPAGGKREMTRAVRAPE